MQELKDVVNDANQIIKKFSDAASPSAKTQATCTPTAAPPATSQLYSGPAPAAPAPHGPSGTVSTASVAQASSKEKHSKGGEASSSSHPLQKVISDSPSSLHEKLQSGNYDLPFSAPNAASTRNAFQKERENPEGQNYSNEGLVEGSGNEGDDDGGCDGDDDDDDDEDDDDEVVDEAPSQGKKISPLEAALLAFKKERQMIQKVSQKCESV